MVLVLVLAACSARAPAAGPAVRAGSAGPTTTIASPAPVRPGPPAVVVGLGDSVTAGTACGCTPFVELYAGLVGRAQGRVMTAVNLGRAGLTTRTLSGQLSEASARAEVGRAAYVLVTIGANDLVPLVARWQATGCSAACIAEAADGMGRGVAAALARIDAARSPGSRVLVTTYWNVFEDGDVADRDYGPTFATWSDQVTRAANSRICTAATRAGATCVDLYTPFEGDGRQDPTPLLADDGDHPNADGHALIARTLASATP